MTSTQAKAIEQIKRSLRALANELNGRDLWEEAQSIHADADCIAEAIEALELDAQDENTEGELLAA